MDFIYFLLKDSKWLSGEAWDMPHRLWYENESGFTLGLILAVVISLVIAVLYYHTFPRIFRNVPLTRLNWLLFLVINLIVVFGACFLIARSGIISYAMANGYIDEMPSIVNVLQGGTMDMWLFAVQNALNSIVLFFALSFLCRIGSRGFNIPF